MSAIHMTVGPLAVLGTGVAIDRLGLSTTLLGIAIGWGVTATFVLFDPASRRLDETRAGRSEPVPER